MVKELKASVTGCQPGDVITAADPQSLIEHLKENTKSVDPEYTEVSLFVCAFVCFLIMKLLLRINMQ